jgi:hypothetical protein
VPEVDTPLCSCGQAPETPCHVIVDCSLAAVARERLSKRLAEALAPLPPVPLSSSRDFAAATEDPLRAKILATWLLSTGRLVEFRLAEEIGGESRERLGRAGAARKRRIPV